MSCWSQASVTASHSAGIKIKMQMVKKNLRRRNSKPTTRTLQSTEKFFSLSMKTFSGKKKYFGIFSITFLITWRSGSALSWWNRRTLVQISPGFCTSSLILIWKLLSNLAPIRIKEIAPNSPWPTRVYEKISSSCGAIDYMIQLEFWDRAFIGVVSI